MGRVNDFFTEERLARLPGHLAIGHNRYSTTGSSVLRNAQPLLVDYAGGSLAIAHNGNLVNAQRLRAELEAHGAIFRSTTDTEVILHLVAQSRAEDVLDGVVEALQQVQGAYSLVLMNHTEIIAARDPRGFRPLCLGQLGDGYVIASETCALDLDGSDLSARCRPRRDSFASRRPACNPTFPFRQPRPVSVSSS